MSLFDLDGQRDQLKAKHPRWRIWYVPRAIGGIMWHAQPEPCLSAHTPAKLDEAITEAESGA